MLPYHLSQSSLYVFNNKFYNSSQILIEKIRITPNHRFIALNYTRLGQRYHTLTLGIRRIHCYYCRYKHLKGSLRRADIKETRYSCVSYSIPLCNGCFEPYHIELIVYIRRIPLIMSAFYIRIRVPSCPTFLSAKIALRTRVFSAYRMPSDALSNTLFKTLKNYLSTVEGILFIKIPKHGQIPKLFHSTSFR